MREHVENRGKKQQKNVKKESFTFPNKIFNVFFLVSRDLTLVVCVWEAPPVELHSSPSCHMAVFDINRWYHSQMPASIRYTDFFQTSSI